jgi:hypothetical protein
MALIACLAMELVTGEPAHPKGIENNSVEFRDITGKISTEPEIDWYLVERARYFAGHHNVTHETGCLGQSPSSNLLYSVVVYFLGRTLVVAE